MDTSSPSNSGGYNFRFGESAAARKEEARLWGSFQMPLHYPGYSKADYESMPEWQLDCVLKEYGLVLASPNVDVEQKRRFAMGAFLWSDNRSPK